MPNLIKITLSKSTPVAGDDSFYIPLIFCTDSTKDSNFAKGTSRSYSSLSALEADFETSSDIYKAATALMGQIRQVQSFRVFRRNDAIKKVKKVVFTGDIVSGDTINGTVNGSILTEIPYATSEAATLTALAAQIQALEGVETATVSGKEITITADTEWDLNISLTVAGDDPAQVTVSTLTPGHCLADDFSDAISEKKNWFLALETSHSKGAILSVCPLLAPFGKMGMFLISESDAKNSTETDSMARTKAMRFNNAVISYSHDTTMFFDHAWAGDCLPIPCGQDRWGERQLQGVTPSPLTDSEYENIVNKNGNCYVEYGGYNLTFLGRTASGDYIDNVRNLYYMANALNKDVLSHLVNSLKIPFTPSGQLTIISTANDTLSRMIRLGILADFVEKNGKMVPGYDISYPKISEISPSDKANRKFGGIKINGTLAGGIEALEFEINIEV